MKIDSIMKIDNIKYIFLFVLYYLLLAQYVPVTEDLLYHFKCGYNWQEINNFIDIIQSQVWHYSNRNGRFVVHSIVQFFCSVSNKHVFYFMSSIVFVFLIKGIEINIKNPSPYLKQINFYLIVLLLFIICPRQGFTLIGHIAYVVNYMWVSAVVVWFVYFYNEYGNRNVSLRNGLLVFFISIVVGSLHEGYSLGLSVFFFMDLLLNKSIRNNNLKNYMTYGFCLGTCFLVFATSNWKRLTMENGQTENLWSDNLGCLHTFVQILYNQFTVISIFAVVILGFVLYRRQYVHFIKQNSLFIFCSCFSLLTCVFLVYTGSHQLMTIGVFGVIIMLRMLNFYYKKSIGSFMQKIIISVVLSIILVNFFPIYAAREDIKLAYTTFMDKMEKSNGGIVESCELDSINEVVIRDRYVRNYTNLDYAMDVVLAKEWNHYLSRYVTQGNSENKASIVLPVSQDKILQSFKNDEVMTKIAPYGLYVIKLTKSEYEGSSKNLDVTYEATSVFGKVKEILKRDNYKEKINVNNINPFFEYKDFVYIVYRDVSFLLERRIKNISLE